MTKNYIVHEYKTDIPENVESLIIDSLPVNYNLVIKGLKNLKVIVIRNLENDKTIKLVNLKKLHTVSITNSDFKLTLGDNLESLNIFELDRSSSMNIKDNFNYLKSIKNYIITINKDTTIDKKYNDVTSLLIKRCKVKFSLDEYPKLRTLFLSDVEFLVSADFKSLNNLTITVFDKGYNFTDSTFPQLKEFKIYSDTLTEIFFNYTFSTLKVVDVRGKNIQKIIMYFSDKNPKLQGFIVKHNTILSNDFKKVLSADQLDDFVILNILKKKPSKY